MTAKEVYEAGFPIYCFTFQEKRKKLLQFLKGDYRRLIRNGVIGQNMTGLALCWSFFPHSWFVQCGDMLTPMQVFSHHLEDALVRRRAMDKCKTASDLRKALSTYSGAQGVSNFRPSAALALYNRYLPKEGGAVWDMSSGFGGRLLGAMACHKVKKYIGTDPATLTHRGLCAMRDELLPMMDTMGYRTPAIELHHMGSEDFPPEPESIDCCLSSPPYSSHEKYSDELTQSCIRFPTNELWMNEYMRMTLENCRVGLKRDGFLVMNLADTKSYPTLTKDFLVLAKNTGFKLVEKLQLALSKVVGTDKWSATHKYEPVFAFRKTPTRTLHVLTAELKNGFEHQLGVGLMHDCSDQITSAAMVAESATTAAINVSKPAAVGQTLVTIEPPLENLAIPGCTYIYAPAGQANEFAPLAANPYKGCGYGCTYCYNTTRKNPEQKATFHEGAVPKKNYLTLLLKDAKKYQAAGITEQVTLCFSTDAYNPFDTSLTRPALEIIQQHGMGICVLTKGGTRALADIDLYRPDRDCFAATLTSLDAAFSRKYESNAAPPDDRIATLRTFHQKGIFTWVSLEPTLDVEASLGIVKATHGFVNLYKIGKVNYCKEISDTIDWRDYTLRMIDLCQRLSVKHYIKRDLQQYLPVGYHNPMRVVQHFLTYGCIQQTTMT